MCPIHFGHKKSDIITSFVRVHVINKFTATFVSEPGVKINFLPLRLRVAASAKQGWGWGK
jgi:hypothetical protein